MRIRSIIAAVIAAFVLAGCAIIPGGDRSILIGGTSLTAPVRPIDETTMAGIETAYGVAVTAAVAYRNLPRCARGTSATIQNPCSQRSVIVRLQGYDQKARVALVGARRVYAAGGINAIDAFRLAKEAIDEFRAILAVYGATT